MSLEEEDKEICDTKIQSLVPAEVLGNIHPALVSFTLAGTSSVPHNCN